MRKMGERASQKILMVVGILCTVLLLSAVGYTAAYSSGDSEDSCSQGGSECSGT
ncbi:MAG: hypothetical protein KJ655_04200 [Candidatus Thermoplasmatota archaeon]|nr:hypothetical protein [Candidatus Thermoplasmatota archaeon]